MKMQRKLEDESYTSSTTRKFPCCGFFGLITLLFLLSYSTNSQSRWDNYAGVYFTGDAQMYYTGPSILVGSDFRVNKDLSVGFYGHYFEKDFGDHGFQAWTLAALGQLYIGKKKKFYAAIGVAWQRALENDDANFDVVDRSIIIPAYRFGRHFIFKKFVISPEINLTGPHSYNNESSIELFTLPSIGTRFQFLRTPK